MYTRRMKEDVPLFLVMVTALENKFMGLNDYVKEKLTNITPEQKSILVQISFARVYTGKALQARAVETNDTEWESSLPEKISNIITFFQLHGHYVQMRHHCIDAIVLSKLSGYENTSYEWGVWLAEFVASFVEHLRCVYPLPNANEFEHVLRWLFHDKSYEAQISKFQSLIASLAGKDAVIRCMRNVEVRLPNTPARIHAHILGDLAQYINNMDLDAAIKVMVEAHKLLPLDRTLYHQQEGQLYFDAMTMTQAQVAVLPKDPKNLAI